MFRLSQTQYLVITFYRYFLWATQVKFEHMGPGHSKCTEHFPIWYFVVTWLSNSWSKPQCAAWVLFDHLLIVFLCQSQSTWAITDWGHFGHMTQYFLNISTIFSQYTELERASYIVWHCQSHSTLQLPTCCWASACTNQSLLVTANRLFLGSQRTSQKHYYPIPH